MNDCFAHVIVKSVSPDGVQKISSVGIGVPVEESTGDYGCTVWLPDSDSKTIFGVDSLQALSLAMQFSGHRIHDLISKGWKFFYPESDDEVPFEIYFIHPDREPFPVVKKQPEP